MNFKEFKWLIADKLLLQFEFAQKLLVKNITLLMGQVTGKNIIHLQVTKSISPSYWT